MSFRLLIDLDVIDFMQRMPTSQRSRLLAHFRGIQTSPERQSDCVEHDETGRRVDISIFEGLAVFYWTDHADRQVKVLKLVATDTT